MAPASVLFISTDGEVIAGVRRQVAALGHDLRVADSFEEAARAHEDRPSDALLVQADAPGIHWHRYADGAAPISPLAPLIVLARMRSIRDAVTAMRAGALDYLPAMPLDGRLLRATLQRAFHEGRDRGAQAGAWLQSPFEGFVTADQRMLVICQVLANAADTRAPLLIEGESGTGKTLLSRLVHENSCRRRGPFLEINCGALAETLLESELFGHSRGAFTSAHQERCGKLEAADGGTLLLDEIDSASTGLQARLLRAVDSGRFERLGDTETLVSDVRVICTTNAPLKRRVSAGEFREDLYHRLNAMRVELPPLRERVVDVPLLARYLLRQLSTQHRRKVTEFSAEVLDRFVHYAWPGNVRELRNVVERGVILARDGMVTLDSLPRQVLDAGDPAQHTRRTIDARPLRDALREPERQFILMALRLTGWNKQHTAQKLGISRSTLYKKMKEHDLEAPEGAGIRPSLRGQEPLASMLA